MWVYVALYVKQINIVPLRATLKLPENLTGRPSFRLEESCFADGHDSAWQMQMTCSCVSLRAPMKELGIHHALQTVTTKDQVIQGSGP
jgi:hypothetical protein